jgi:hypothetical protein
MKILLAGLLILSLALNIFLWTRLSSRSDQLKSAQTSASELEELRRQNQELQLHRTSASNLGNDDARELARLRNEVGQLRKQSGDATTLRVRAAEAAQLRTLLAAATQNLAAAQSELADAVKLSPDDLRQLQDEAHSVKCVSNLKQIGLAARLWAQDQGNMFPPDFVSMQNELGTPKVLFCPADTASIPVSEWSQLNPSAISYRFLNPNGNVSDPSKPLATCRIHGHVCLSDRSVHRQ